MSLKIRPDAHEAALRALRRGEILTVVQVGQYAGSDASETTAARIGQEVLRRLDELGHIIGRLPGDPLRYELRSDLKRLESGVIIRRPTLQPAPEAQ